MKKYINNFVGDYKAILKIKQNLVFDKTQTNILRNVVLSTLMIALVFVALGWIFKLSENFHYVFISVNTVIVGSFVIFKVVRELKFKYLHKLEYSTFIAISYDVFYLIGLLSLVNTLIILFLLVKIISSILLILILIIGILINFIVYLMYTRIELLQTNRTNMFLTSLWIGFLYWTLFYVLDIRSIMIAYVVATAIILALYIYKLHLHTDNMHVENILKYTLLLFGAIFVRYTLLQYDNNIDKIPFLESSLSGEPIDEPLSNITLFEYNGHLFYQEEGQLFEYDETMHFIEERTPDIDNIQYYFTINNQLKAVAYDETEDVANQHYRYNATLYDITNSELPTKELDFLQHSGGQINTMIELQEEMYVIVDDYRSVKLYSISDDSLLDTSAYLDNEIIYQTENEIVYVYGDGFRMLATNQYTNSPTLDIGYSNDKYFEHIDDQICIYDVGVFFDFEDKEGRCTDLDMDRLKGFYYDGSNYFIQYTTYSTGDFLQIYNKKMKLIEETSVYRTLYFTKEIFIENDYERVAEYDANGDIIQYQYVWKTLRIDPNHFVQYEINGDSHNFNSFVIALSIVFVFSIPMNLPLFKGGEPR